MLYLRKNINICLNKSNFNSKIGIYNKKNLIFLILKRNELFLEKDEYYIFWKAAIHKSVVIIVKNNQNKSSE